MVYLFCAYSMLCFYSCKSENLIFACPSQERLTHRALNIKPDALNMYCASSFACYPQTEAITANKLVGLFFKYF